MTNKRNQTCFACLEELQEGKHSGKYPLIRWSIEKKYFLQYSYLLLEVLAMGFTLKLPNCGKRLCYIEAFALSIKKLYPVASAIYVYKLTLFRLGGGGGGFSSPTSGKIVITPTPKEL